MVDKNHLQTPKFVTLVFISQWEKIWLILLTPFFHVIHILRKTNEPSNGTYIWGHF
jgi:hypothetical protein